MSSAHVHDGVGFICNHVLTGSRPANYIVHQLNDRWQFLCGEEDGHDSSSDASVICSSCAFANFVDGVEREDVEIGYVADRPNRESRWIIRPMNDEELNDE